MVASKLSGKYSVKGDLEWVNFLKRKKIERYFIIWTSFSRLEKTLYNHISKALRVTVKADIQRLRYLT